MNYLPTNPEGQIELPVAGFGPDGTELPGYASLEWVQANMPFLPDSAPWTEEQYQAVLTECDRLGWLTWRRCFEVWRSQGIV